MKKNKQKIAIAEACGWIPRFTDSEAHLKQWLSPNKKDPNWHFLPDYPNDLNAMHEAEKSLTPAQFRDYRKRLNWRKDYGVTAEASERAEDFLKAINKWTDEP